MNTIVFINVFYFPAIDSIRKISHSPNERSFAHRVLTNEHHLRLGIEFNVGEEGTLVEVVISVAFLHGQDRLLVDALQSSGNHGSTICHVVAGARSGAIADGARGRFICPVCHVGVFGLVGLGWVRVPSFASWNLENDGEVRMCGVVAHCAMTCDRRGAVREVQSRSAKKVKMWLVESHKSGDW